MLVNNFGLIAEATVFSSGFASAPALSIKSVALFDLCRKQFSHTHQDHWLSTPLGFKKNEKPLYWFDQFHMIRDCVLFPSMRRDSMERFTMSALADQRPNSLTTPTGTSFASFWH
jgi:hypothetical protein